MKLTVNRNFDDVQFCGWDLVRGEREELRVAFQGEVPDDAVLTFAAKESRDATGFVLYCDEFVREGDEFVAVVVLNTVELNGLVTGRNAVQLVAELMLETGRITQKFVLKLAVKNDVIKGDEGLPVPAPEFVTKVYLEEELRKHSADMEAVADRAEGFADAAANGAAAAAGSEALARKWATNPKDAVVEGSGATVKFSAKHWSAYAQQYAQNASDSEVAAAAARLDCELFRDCAYNQAVASSESASVSATQANIAADLVAGVAGVGDQVTAAQNAAATATSKATDAANSATAASNSKTAAATSATNAKASETNAANSKTAAATSASNAAASETAANNSKTAAASSASAAQTSETNAAASKTAAAASASNAAASERNAAASKTAAETAAANAVQAANAVSEGVKAAEAILAEIKGISIGTVTDVAPGGKANVTLVDGKLNFWLVKGDKGDKGESGSGGGLKYFQEVLYPSSGGNVAMLQMKPDTDATEAAFGSYVAGLRMSAGTLSGGVSTVVIRPWSMEENALDKHLVIAPIENEAYPQIPAEMIALTTDIPDGIVTTSNIANYCVASINNQKGHFTTGTGISVTSKVIRTNLVNYPDEFSIKDTAASDDWLLLIRQGSSKFIQIGNSSVPCDNYMKYFRIRAGNGAALHFYLGNSEGNYGYGGMQIDVGSSPISTNGSGFNYNGKQVLTQ